MGWGPGDPLQTGGGLPQLARAGDGREFEKEEMVKILCVQTSSLSLDGLWPGWIEVEGGRGSTEGTGRRTRNCTSRQVPHFLR